MPKGIIIKGLGGLYDIKTPSGVISCKARGIFRKNNIKPLIGDMVEVEYVDDAKNECIISAIDKRKTEIKRPAVANIDKLIIVIASASPKPDIALLNKLLLTAEVSNINPIICVNKTDIDNGKMANDIEKIYINTNYKIVKTSCANNTGFEDLKKCIDGSINAFAGQSGAGKSSILNTIMEKDIMITGKLSNKIQRGKHTTRHTELFIFNEKTYIMDTPGFSSFEISNMNFENIENYFPEIEKIPKTCRFNGCSHINEPDCAVKDAYNKGKISENRYQWYKSLREELKERYDNRYN